MEITTAGKIPEFEKAEAFILSELKEKLSPSLYYHNQRHTLDVLDAAVKMALALKISPTEIKLLRVAAAFHDAGFIHIYKNHEQRGCEMVREYLPAFCFNQNQQDIICGMIMATKIPQTPATLLEQIIADADLDYLGRPDVYEIAQTLFEELKAHSMITTGKEWLRYQVDFLKLHHYHTAYSQKLREPAKQAYIGELIKKMESA